MTRRILHIGLPRLATDRIARRRGPAPAAPEVTTAKLKSAMRVEAVNAMAEDAGLLPGMTLAEARALVPGLKVSAADPTGDAEALINLARAADRYTPLVGLDAPAGLMLDITGCAHLFGGEAAMLETVLTQMARWGFTAEGAVAETPLFARGLARFGAGGVVPQGAGGAAFRSLPAAALMLPDDTLSTLQRLGLKTVADVLRQPRAALVQRFGATMARRIEDCEAAGNAPITPLTPVAPYVTERRFAEPLMQIEAVALCLTSLAERLAAIMERRGEGARRLTVRLFHADGIVRDATVLASEPLADPARMGKLLASRLESISARIETDSGIDLIRLHGSETGPLPKTQAILDGGIATAADLAALIDTLCERLGPAAVARLAPADTHQPAAAQEVRPAQEARPAREVRPAQEALPAREALPGREVIAMDPWESAAFDAPPDRPLKLLATPEPVDTLASVPDGPPVRFVWRRVFHNVAVAEGPERIAAPWWDRDTTAAAPPTCDYFRVEDTDGRRFWMFRQGLYGREDATPRWFMHGLFA